MLTRLEVHGFKNLLNFAVDFGPYTCIAGPNGVGKSNLFDAIRFLSLLADHDLTQAALKVREDDQVDDVRDFSWGGGDVRDLFWGGAKGPLRPIEIAAEMIITPDVKDDFGREGRASSTFLRYEIEVGYEPALFRGALGQLVLHREELKQFTEGQAGKHLPFPHSAQHFRKSVISNERRSRKGYISTRTENGQTIIHTHQDAGSRGPGQSAPAASAPRTIVGTTNNIVTPTILAVRREMQDWRFLALEPSAMRRPDRFQTEPSITDHGGHMPATLYRLMREAEQNNIPPEHVYTAVANKLAALVPFHTLNLDIDEARQLLILQAQEHKNIYLPAASLSDGTLRFLVLSMLATDPQEHGLICIEEPENGIHPAKMEQMVNLLHELAVDPMQEVSLDNPLRQVIVATHSPAFVQLHHKTELLFAQEVTIRNKDGETVRTLRCIPLDNTWRSEITATSVSTLEILAYLSAPPDAQLRLPIESEWEAA